MEEVHRTGNQSVLCSGSNQEGFQSEASVQTVRGKQDTSSRRMERGSLAGCLGRGGSRVQARSTPHGGVPAGLLVKQ